MMELYTDYLSSLLFVPVFFFLNTVNITHITTITKTPMTTPTSTPPAAHGVVIVLLLTISGGVCVHFELIIQDGDMVT